MSLWQPRVASTLAALALLSLSACADESTTEVEASGKKKIAYAPYQKARLTHKVTPIITQQTNVSAERAAHTPEVEVASASATLNPAQPSSLTAEGIAQAAQGVTPSTPAPHGPQHGSALAAGWPGAKAPQAQPHGQQPQGQPHGQPQQQTAPAHAPTSAPTSHPMKPAGHPTSQPQQPALTANYVYGQLSLDPSLVGQVKPGSVLFVIVRRHVEGGRGMLIAATKLENISKDSFPMPFVVKQADAMMGAPLAGNVTVSARIDQDGDAISKQPGDLVGEAPGVVVVGQNPVKMSINKSL